MVRSPMAKPVFHDPAQSRCRWLRRLFDVLGLSITLLVMFLVYTAIRDEQLPGLFLPEQNRPYHALKETGMEVFPLVKNLDETEWKPEIAKFLMDPAARATFRQQIDAFLASDKYRGLMVDVEDFAKSAQPGYLALLGELSSDLHGKGLKLYVSVPARDRDFDYATIAARTDGLVLMNYEDRKSVV